MKEFLISEHPLYTLRKEEWEQGERRLAGGIEALAELAKFRWEEEDGESHKMRKRWATYPKFPAIFASSVVGFLLRNGPEVDAALNFGALGKVTRTEGQRDPSRAELIYYNADSTGDDGSQWDVFWGNVMMWAVGATGHRWVIVDAARSAPANFADEMAGMHPFFTELSPLDVTNWHYDAFGLRWAVYKIASREPRIVSDKLEGNESVEEYILLVRNGVTELGADYQNGGWWHFDTDGNLKSADATGDWTNTRGRIPLFPVFADRDRRRMSRSPAWELGQIAVAHMNMESAADFDAWDAAESIRFILGASLDSFTTMASKLSDGAKFVPVPLDPANPTVQPTIYDSSSGSVASEVFTTRLTSKNEQADRLAAAESIGTPDSSGRSKEAGFASIKAPLLARLAAEMEQAQNLGLHFLEGRWLGTTGTAYVQWEREFDLAPLIDDIESMFRLNQISGIRSPTLDASMMLQAARERRVLSDETMVETVRTELGDSAVKAQENAQRMRDAFAELDVEP